MDGVTIVEVAPRDGFQSIGPFIPTPEKIGILDDLAKTGLRRIEVSSFVSPKAITQMRDAADVCAWAVGHVARPSVLVPNLKGTMAALAAGIRELVFVLSVSEAHNLANVRRSTSQSLDELSEVVREASAAGASLRVALGTSFHCPFDGIVPVERVLEVAGRAVTIAPQAELCLSDTLGKATPDHVGSLFERVAQRVLPADRLAFHGHDTFGMGVANVHAAYLAGVRIFDAAAAGIGGCPFAPGAAGNVATEDLAFLFAGMGVPTGIDMHRLLRAADRAAGLEGAQPGGRLRIAGRAGTACAA